jgi:hypothetical protein
MRIKVEVLLILLILIFSSVLSFVSMPLIPAVKATYVEGFITQDTVWTLVDSPFVISNETVVCEGVTLTIEPGVEVRFGGHFSLTVEGRLVAEGTEDKMIRFTSNILQPEASWVSIVFNSTQTSSLLFCIVEYGTNGIFLESGSVNIQNSTIQFNSESGITVLGGNLVIKNSVFVNNTLSGIYIAGGQVTVQENIISSNGDGIALTGDLTSAINITRNEISFNTRGVWWSANAYDTIIVNNTISKNDYGFYISTDTATNITRNYILNNINVGIFYETGKEHAAHFNDIYSNGVGMKVSSEAFVDATYNYWGSPSGPYHEFLNPRGEGNSVVGDGANIDFVFFLTRSFNSSNVAPTAVLWTDKVIAAPNQDVTFIGTDSYDGDEDGQVNQYLFDFGDGTPSDWTTLSIFTHSYSSTGVYTASLMVRDDFNTTSSPYTVRVNVTDLTPLDVSVALSSYTVEYNEEVLVTVYVSYCGNAVENANVTLFSVKGGRFASDLTNSTGYFTTTFKAPNVTEVTNIRIIARASNASCADGADYKYLKVLPPLNVNVTADQPTVKSEETTTITVYVTGSFEEPVANALLMLSSENGTLSAITGVTDLNGMAVFNFTASQTLTQINAIITVTATKTGYGRGQAQLTIPIEPKVLAAEITANPAVILSEEASLITAYITCDSVPIPNATVTILSDAGGNFSKTSETTDSDGNAIFLFTAPKVRAMDGLNVTITVTANKTGYVNGEKSMVVTIKPKILSVQITAEPNATISEGKVNINVKVTYNESPVAEANVTLIPEAGVFLPNSTLSDDNGVATFVFTAPPVDPSRNITLRVRAAKDGYADGENTLNITVSPGVLNAEIIVEQSSVAPEKSTVVTVYVSCNQTQAPVASVLVSVSCSSGSISPATNLTSADGYCTFVFNAPQATTLLSVDITANATKYGYVSCEKQTSITVNPEVGKPTEGWPLMTILLILIPIVIVIVVAVLVKLKIIVLSSGEEEEE